MDPIDVLPVQVSTIHSTHHVSSVLIQLYHQSKASRLMFPLIVIASIVLAVKCIQKCAQFVRFYRMLSKIPCPPSHPLFGHAVLIMYLDQFKFIHGTYVLIFQMFTSIIEMFGHEKLVKIWAGFTPVVLLYHPEAIENVLSNINSTHKADHYRFLQPWLGSGLVTSNNGKWKQRRKMLTPTFHFRILQDFMPVFNEHANLLLNQLDCLAIDPQTTGAVSQLVNERFQNKFKVNEQYAVDIVPILTQCTLEVICETAMGIRLQDHECNKNNNYANSLHQVSKLVLWRMTRPWFWNDFLFYFTSERARLYQHLAAMKQFTRNVIQQRKQDWHKRFASSSAGPNCQKLVFLDLLLQHHFDNPQAFTTEDIRDEVDTFMFAGHDTTAMSICWILYLLGLHPEVQNKLRDEIDQVINENNLINQSDQINFNSDHLKQMKYLDCILKESQRVYPTAPFYGRKLTEDTSVAGYQVPKGTTCVILTYAVHRSPLIYEHPTRFIPERFLPENSRNRHPFAFIPFSAGPRNCIGQKFSQLEQKIIVANIIRKYIIHSTVPQDQLIVVGEIILRPKHGLPVVFIRRHSKSKAI